MPELPEVETIRRGLAPHLCGRTITAVQCHRPSLRYPLPDLSVLEGQRITAVRRRAKYLLFDLEKKTASISQTLVWHLGMTGQFHILPLQAQAGAHEHVCIQFEDGQSLRYRDARRFGYADLLCTASIEQHQWFCKLGPEPLLDDFHVDHLRTHCVNRKAPIKNVIMNASVVVGVGNIYASESLFRAGIHPARAAGNISAQRLKLLVDVIQQVLIEAIAAGGSSISDFVNADGKPGYFSHSFQVYGRQGERCLRCPSLIKRMTQAGRSTFYCPQCQR